jgi:hypothetical protein
MKKKSISLLITSFFISSLFLVSFSQTADSVLLGPGSAQACFYRLADGQKTMVSYNDWNLSVSVRPSAFPSNPLPGTTIRINEAFGTNVYIIPSQLPADFATPLDTTGLSGWSRLHDSEIQLNLGALNTTRNLSNPFDFGWGVYNSSTKNVVGDSLFLITGPNGLCKKLWIEQLVWDTMWVIKTCNIDGSSPYTFQISKKQYNAKNFVYLDVRQSLLLDKEPNKTDWDLLFLKYMSPASQGATTILYGVTGVWTNEGIQVNQISGIPSQSAQPDGLYSSSLSEIGFDWKAYNGSTMSYDIPDTLTYFVKDRQNQIFRINFTAYSGNSSGKIYFNISPYAANAVLENNFLFIRLYPVPANDYLMAEGLSEKTACYDLSGKQVMWLQNGENNLSALPAGMYCMPVSDGRVLRFIRR